MGSLFTRIFLSFWLTALLLGAAIFAAERTFGADPLDRAQERLAAHRETVATLYESGGLPAVRGWLGGIARDGQAAWALVDAEGQSLAGRRFGHLLREHAERAGVRPGTYRLRPGLFAVIGEVPGADPLYLIAVVRPEHYHAIPLVGRLAIAVAVSGLVCFILAARITRPVRRLRHAAQALAAGDLSVRVGPGGRDELGALARDFDLMASRLRDLLESQRRLLRDVSHELRSPLARLKVALELARKKGEPEKALDRVERETERLDSLVTDVLSLARLEAGRAGIERRPVALGDVLGGVVQDAAFEAEAVGRTVELTAEAAPPPIDGDPVLLRSAIENVVRNAIRHTPPGSAVEVSLGTAQGEALVAVRDAGPGVPEAELARLFEPFTRVGDARDRGSGGYGLGLAISRRAVEAHGGWIRAENRDGGGLCVLIGLPLGTEARV